jgi:hypothetical protein
MNENNLFEGLPGLADTEGLNNFINQQQAQAQNPQANIPPMLQPQAQPQENPAQDNPQPQAQPQSQPQVYNIGGVQYTAAQLEQIVNQNKAMAQRQAMAAQQSQPKSAYTPEQAAIIKELINRGVPMERIQNALRQNTAQAQMNQRMQNIETYLQQQQYAIEESAFIDKMTNFGNKFGLNEDDLVEFANVALSKGINVAQVTDVEAVFRALYPEQYAIRMQRMSAQPSSQMFGGSSIPEMPRANASKLEDSYVEAFLRAAMPNQYNQYNRK